MLSKLKQLRKLIEIKVVMGSPGASKGTSSRIAHALIQNPHFQLLEMSSVLSKRSKTPDELGLALQQQEVIRKSGGLVDDQPAMQALEERIIKEYKDGKRKFTLDGGIRRVTQGKALICSGVDFQCFFFKVPNAIAISRLRKRAEIEGRPDDLNPQVIQRRMAIFERETINVVKLFKSHNSNSLIVIDGTVPIRTRVATMLRKLGFNGYDLQRMMSKLDTPGHPANDMLREALREPQQQN